MADFRPHLERLTAVAGSPSGRCVAIGGRRDAANVAGSTVHVFGGKKLEPRHAIDVAAPVTALAFAGEDRLFVADEGGGLTTYDLSGDRPTLGAAHSGPKTLALAADERVYAAREDGSVLVFDANGTELSSFALSKEPLRAITFDPSSETIAVGGDEGVVFAVRGGEPRRMPCGEGGVRSIAFTGDGRVAVGCGDGSVRLCFLEGAVDEEDRSGDQAHRGPVAALFVGPGRLHSVGQDGNLASWFVDSRRKPKITEVGGTLTSGVLLDAERIALVGEDRRLTIVGLDDKGTPHQTKRYGSAFERLLADLGARGNQARLDAVMMLQGLAEDEARELLDRALTQDRDAEVRKAAAVAIGHGERRRSRAALKSALDDADANARRAAFDALATIDARTPVGPLTAALGSRHADLRKLAVERLPSHRAASPLVPGLVARSLSDADDDVRKAALESLFTLERDTPLAAAEVALDRGPPDVRKATLLRLARANLSATSDGQHLVERSLDDDDASIRRTAFYVAVAARPRLAARLAAVDPDAAKALEVIGTAAADGAPEEADLVPLFAALACRRADAALLGAARLAALGDLRAVGALLQLSRESKEEVRAMVVAPLRIAARAIPNDDRATARLSWLLDDSSEKIANAAFEALLDLAGEGADARLDLAALALDAGRDDIRSRSLELVVAAQGEPRADELLGRALDDESSKVRTEALRTLLAWHSDDLQPALRRGASSRHADVRRSVVDRLAKAEGEWARRLLLALVADASADVGLAALTAITKDEAEQTKSDVFLMALHSPRPAVRAAGCKGCRRAPAEDLRARLLELITEEHRDVHLAAIEAADALFHRDVEPYRRAFASVFFELRVRAAELLGKRRDKRAVEPMKALLRIPKIAFDRPTDDLRARAARALADVGDPSVIPFYISLLDDEDGTVREMGARGLATACRPGREKPLVDALAHADMAVRSWAAEGLARLGDDRAAVVLAGTLTHEHRPLRVGAILGFVALGPDGVRGLLAGLQDPDREVADLVLAIVVARDIALAQAGLVPDLLVLALSSAHPEVRFAAARALETRTDVETIGDVARSMVGPKPPERGAKPKDLPSEEEQTRLLSVVVAALASDNPEQRYAAARVLELRATPKGYWREARRLASPGGGERPHTNWEDESRTRTKKGWLRRLFARGEAQPGPVDEVLFGTYAGLVRQAPPEGQADETHRVRRDSVARLVALSSLASVGRDAVLPIVRRALSDPHHLVRRRAQTALTELYPDDPITPLLLSLDSSADDVGRAAVDLVIERALDGDQAARELAPRTLAAKSRDARAHALSRLPRLFEEGSLEPWFIALDSPFADVRRLVVDRLAALPNADGHEARIRTALGRALESDHEDLRMQAARSLARRGDPRTADVFAGFLRSDDERTASHAIEGLVTLASAASEHAAIAATTLTGRLEDDPDATADRRAIVRALGRIRSDAASDTLFGILADDDTALGDAAWEALVAIARDTSRPNVPLTGGGVRLPYDDALAIRYATAATASVRPDLRVAAATLLNAVEDAGAETILAKLIDDRDTDVRIAAAESLAFRAEHIEGASIAALERAIAAGRRELVLPAATGLAVRGRVEAFRPLLLVLKAGLPHERQQAMLGLGVLGDDRAVDELIAFVDPSAELEEADLALVPFAAEALASMAPRIADDERRREIRSTVVRLAREGAADVRRQTITGLRRAGDDASREQIERVVADRYDDLNLRRFTLDQLIILAAPASELVLADALGDPDATVRRKALAALTKIFADDPTRVALHALDSKHSDVSAPAAAFLAKGGEAATLVARIAAIGDREVRRRLRLGLARRGLAPSEELRALLASDDAHARAEAAFLAGAAGNLALGPDVLRALERSETEKEHRAWHAAMWAAARLKADASAAAFRAITSEDAPADVRVEALRLIAGEGRADDVVRVKPALSASDASVRAAAAAAIVALDGAAAPAILRETAVPDPGAVGPVVRAALDADAAAVLASDERPIALFSVVGDRRVDALVAAASGAGESAARLSAIHALGRVGTDAAATALQSILDAEGEPDAVRAATFKALRRAQRQQQREART